MQRRNFIRNISLAGLVINPATDLVLENKTSQNISPLPADLSPLEFTGRIHQDGKGIAGVAVSDGRNVVQTDSSGNYRLKSNHEAEFIFISVPAGYAIPHEKGIADFYVPVDKGKAVMKHDFILEKLQQDDTKHHFVVWADTQMISRKDAELLKTQSVPDLQALVKSMPEDTLLHGIGCGDLVWDHFELFDDYKEAIGMTGVPFYNVIGNHDMDLDARTDEISSRTFKKQFGPTYYSFNRGHIHYVVLDDVFYIGVAKKYIGYITENQFQWLEQDLALVKPGSTVVVCLHIPTFTGHARRHKVEEPIGGTVSNREQLYKMLAPYNVHIMSGHTHFNDNWEKDNIMEHNHGTVCGAWWTGPVCGDGTPNGYGVYEVDGNAIKWYYKATGKPREHQLRIYAKGRVKEFPEAVAANVWNYDEKWTVEWMEDGVLKGKMEKKVALDPWAAELYAGPELPKKHKFVEPTLNDHMFFCTPSGSAREITVKATDRFGNVYEEKTNVQI